MYSSDDKNEASGSTEALRKLADFNLMAYVKPVSSDKGTAYGVFAADGTQLAVFSTRDAAYFAAKQHDLEPVLIH